MKSFGKGTLNFIWITYNVGLIKHNEVKLTTGGLGASKTKTAKILKLQQTQEWS